MTDELEDETLPLDPYPFQEADIAAALEHDGVGFVVAETGAGKTLTAVEIGLSLDVGTRLVIAPQGTHEKVWRQTIMRQDPSAVVRQVNGSVKGRDAMNALEWGEAGWYLVTPQLFTRWGFAGIRPDLAIADEAHLLAGGGRGTDALKKLKAPHRLAMSGTMVRNKIENFWYLLRWMYPERSEPGDIADINRERWITEYMRTKYDRFAPTNRVVVGELHPGRLASLIPLYIQHFKRMECCDFHPDGFLHDVPEPVHITETVELLPEQKRLIKRMEDDYVAWLEMEGADKNRPVIAKLPIAQRVRLRQMTLGVPSFTADGEIGFAPDCPSPKLDKLIELHERVGEPIVAATSSQKFAAEAVRRLNARGIRSFEWSSKARQNARDEALEAFRHGGYDVIVGVTEAIGTGIDGLQDASGVLVSLERSQDLASETQLEGRLDRRGQRREDGVLHYEIIAEDSMDLGIMSRQLKRRLDLNRSLRRDRMAAAR